MSKIGDVKLGDLPRVVLSVDGESHAVAQAAREGVDILEVRIDQFSGKLTAQSMVNEVKILKRHEMPLIGTVRADSEGGKAEISDALREEFYEAILPIVDAIDIDISAPILESVVLSARKNNNTVILSHHDFSNIPSDLQLREIVKKAVSLGADIVKIATFAKNESDVLRLLHFTADHQEKNLVTIAMGNIGSLSRLLFPLAGSLMTYTSVNLSDGQVPPQRLIEDLRFYYPRYNEELIIRTGLLELA